MFYLSTDTIVKSYHELTKNEIKNPNILFSFIILKGCKFNSNTYEPLDNIPKYGIELTKRLSWLFGPNEKPTTKSNFINPLNMSEWGSNPTEPMDKWVKSRLKNNIIGGATTWRNIIKEDLKTDQIKFTYNYLEEIKSLTNVSNSKIDLIALSIWSNRFTQFDRKVTLGELTQEFLKTFNIDEQEQETFFHTNNTIEIEFNDKLHDTKYIRNIIGQPNISEEWINVEKIAVESINNVRGFHMNTVQSNYVTKERIEKLLELYNQVILSGPPGTSKSYLSSEVAKSYDTVKRIQFHPQYSYQQFIGGYVVDKDIVVYKKGILLDLLETIRNKPSEEKHLLIVEEINRANLSQVFGEVVQCLDRGYNTEVLINGKLKKINLPNNLHILGTMNSSDRTIGSIDLALRRRFVYVYCPPNPTLLLDYCPSFEGFSVYDLLIKINDNLIKTHKNRELVIGHALFFDKNVKKDDGKYYWDFNSLELLFNFKILPMIEEFCYGNYSQIKSVIGEDLSLRLTGDEFQTAIKEFVYQ